MTDQPSSPAQSTRQYVSTAPYSEVKGPSGQVFQVMSLELDSKPGLAVSKYKPDDYFPEKEHLYPSHQVDSHEIKFEAIVRSAGAEGWKIGWLQTVESSEAWVLYTKDGNSAKHHTKLKNRMRDGDDDEGCWYGDPDDADSHSNVTAVLQDGPNLPFHIKHPVISGMEGLADMVPAGAGGCRKFWSWLVALREENDGTPLEPVVYLYHVNWKVEFACDILGAGKKPTLNVPGESGASLIAYGTGQGPVTAVLRGAEAGQEHEENWVERL
jgi:hypothetical protein